MKLIEILNLINDEELEKIGKECNIDKGNNKITGSFILKSFIHCIILKEKLSLRALELICNNTSRLTSLLKSNDKSKSHIDHSSLGKRLERINWDYFKKIYQHLVDKCNYIFTRKKSEKFHRFDSTLISLSGKLLKDGMNAGGKMTDRHIKITVGMRNSIPSSVRLCESQSEASENVALVKAINECKIEKESILLFDRGISKSKTFQAFNEEEKNSLHALVQIETIA